MWNLDTAVRDVIPDKVYNTYNWWKHTLLKSLFVSR
jgi:hypothetical protein